MGKRTVSGIYIAEFQVVKLHNGVDLPHKLRGTVGALSSLHRRCLWKLRSEYFPRVSVPRRPCVNCGTGMSAGVVAAITLLAVPGIGQVFSMGFGAAALLGLFGAGIGSAISKSVPEDTGAGQSTADEKCSDDATFFREVLKEGRTLIVVRTESQEAASVACRILDRLGLGIQGPTPLKMQTSSRQVGDVAIVDVSGRVTLGEGNVILREVVRGLLEKGNDKILFNLRDVGYVDSSGLGELVNLHDGTQPGWTAHAAQP